MIGAFGFGGVIYSLSVPALVNYFAERRLMLIGGALAAIALTLAALHFPWYVQVAIFGMFGFGFYLLHGCIQVHVTDLSTTARGAATSAAFELLLHRAGDRSGALRLRLCAWQP